MTWGNLTIKNTAHASIVAKATVVTTISRVEHTVKEYNKFEKSLVTITRSVISDHNGGQHGYTGVILDTLSAVLPQTTQKHHRNFHQACKTNANGNVHCNFNGRRDCVSQRDARSQTWTVLHQKRGVRCIEILYIAQIIKHIMSSAAEEELGALYINMGHPQNATPPIQTNN